MYTDFVNFLCTSGARRSIRQCVTPALSIVERKFRCHKYGNSIMEDENDESFRLTKETLKAFKQNLIKQ